MWSQLVYSNAYHFDNARPALGLPLPGWAAAR